MYKHVGFVTKRPDMTFDEFVAYWRTTHADIARTLPGVRQYVINPIDRSVYPDSPVDGFAELWFDSEADAEEAWRSAAGQATSGDAAVLFGGMAVVNLHEIDIIR